MVPSRRPARAVLASWPPSLDPLDRMGDLPRAPAQSQLRARKSLLILLLQSRTTVSPETSIPRTDARSLTGCLPPTSTSCPFGTSRLPLVHVGDCRGRSSQESAILRKEREDRVDVNEACEPVAAHGVPAAARTTHRRTEPGGRRAAHLVH